MEKSNEYLKQLYEDAVYWHLVHKGLTEDKARSVVTQLVEDHLLRIV